MVVSSAAMFLETTFNNFNSGLQQLQNVQNNQHAYQEGLTETSLLTFNESESDLMVC
ncbi:hypothetical protein [Mesoflavibacter zeaxanthinifaciens]|uniref:hypothetical protein n=1 Tax=Mesoflavibacter zeaxanthinifaciens TaxID=393060 RepID=UPI003A927D16